MIRAGIEEFAGVGRRFDVKGVINNITLIDDYGHHPAEIRATLEAARGCHFERVLDSVLLQRHDICVMKPGTSFRVLAESHSWKVLLRLRCV